MVYAAAAWALVFAIVHLLWASGWYVGLDQEQASAAFARRWFLIYDLAVAALCLFAVPVALALGMPWGRWLPRRALGAVAWAGTGLLVLRAGGSMIQAGYLIATGRFRLQEIGIWEPWFVLGATLFGISTWRYWRSPTSATDRDHRQLAT